MAHIGFVNKLDRRYKFQINLMKENDLILFIQNYLSKLVSYDDDNLFYFFLMWSGIFLWMKKKLFK
ncbi:hypothetical protein B0186_11165 [Canicola haemoglobinophilus]|nr:hypothetical protein B0186_11165 [Canicola haemoglobinophilus]